MKNKIMVLAKVAVEVAKLAARSLIKYSGKEKQFWASRYGKVGGRAVRHGLATGPGIGSLLSSDNGIEPDVSPKRGSYESSSNKSNQTRGRSKRYSGSSRSRRFQRCSCKR